MNWIVGSDIGGTFTDIVYIDKDGTLHTSKVPSTPENYGRGVVNGIHLLAKKQSLAISEMSEMVHGCTIATNAILEGKGAKTALITTRGFRDVLELRRIRVPKLYDPLYVKPQPLSPRNLRFEVTERLDSKGQVITELDENEVREIVKHIKKLDVTAVAVCFLHSYVNSDHEKRVGKILRELAPDLFISLSVDILPQIREYERTSTTVINAYVGPPVHKYLEEMEKDLRTSGCPATMMMMQSSGGTVSAKSVMVKPAQIIECGPAAGVVGSAYIAEKLGIKSAITFDMGGTTAKGSLIEDGELIYAENYEVGASMSSAGSITGGAGYALKLPVIDISEVGAGGGSIIRIDRAGSIKVGPDSAGSVPGPVCYGTGGLEPTVTDANVVTGFLSQEALAGGSVPIDATLSYKTIEEKIAKPLNLDVYQAAYGVHQVANATMVRAIKAVTTYRGRDPRDFSIFAFGGNGGVHGAGIARSLEVKQVIVPLAAGVFSAVGLMVAKRSVTVAGAFPAKLSSFDLNNANTLFDKLKKDADALIDLKENTPAYKLEAEMRYVGQAFELTVPLKKDFFDEEASAQLRIGFDEEHERRFGHKFDEGNNVEIVSLKVRATDPVDRSPQRLRQEGSYTPLSSRMVYYGDEFGLMKTPIVNRSEIQGTEWKGPVIIEEYEGTTIVPPDASVHRDQLDNLVINLDY
ncbi:hydantoinase/oxoprolinase family protein [Sneathiella litorea]|uniref:Hydantoinase/oxoprolinase family protein n=1 Tax=Sneathiella litorea TaxID=2606216 RepID=A0A6L8W6K2_9PROT|nr:hydantoinase/oxoprolinase family protein [Sneathiella litorea]MZR30731.1 hydantoinase/oxoprolinase family protein [Sneathiella litorea]